MNIKQEVTDCLQKTAVFFLKLAWFFATFPFVISETHGSTQLRMFRSISLQGTKVKAKYSHRYFPAIFWDRAWIEVMQMTSLSHMIRACCLIGWITDCGKIFIYLIFMVCPTPPALGTLKYSTVHNLWSSVNNFWSEGLNKPSLLKKDSHRLGMGKLFEHNCQKNVWY